MDFQPSARTTGYLERVQRFMRDHIEPVEGAYLQALHAMEAGGDWRQWKVPPVMVELKARAKAAGLWNLFLPDAKLGAGLSTLEYAPLAEAMGRSFMAPEVFNCSAPDTGNMEVLWRYGSPEQQERWLKPLLAGDIRSVFCMTEPDAASSDATNMQATAEVDGDHVVLNGKKWWSSGLGHPNAKVAIFMGRTSQTGADRHHQHSMVLVPLDAPGVEIVRMLPVYGDHDAPHGHGEVHFHDVRLPASALISGPGMGFEIAQGRLGPGRIHHCMRCIGAAERALELMIDRGMGRTAFGKPLLNLGGNRERVAEARIAIDQARLLTLYAAWKLDDVGAMGAMTEISAIKVVAPNVLQQVVDDAIQVHGGAGVSRDTPLAGFFAQARSLRIADGPDEVHKGVITRIELAKRGFSRGLRAMVTPVSIPLDEGKAVRSGEALDVPAVDAWIKAQVPTLEGTPEVTQYTGGASNWTYRLKYPNRDLILRRPPAGTKAKSAHDMAREYTVQQALKPAYPVVPTMVGLCQDPAVLGAEFYVMDRIPGLIPRKHLPRGLNLDRTRTRQLCLNVVDKLIELHGVKPDAVGLTSLGKGPGYPQRQISGWSDRYEKARTWNVPRMKRVREWLAAHVPPDIATCVIHNDWRFDNVVLRPEDPTEVIGVLDWEMATLGDPLMDLGNTLAYWVHADDDFFLRTTRRQPTDLPGMLRREEVVAYYLEKTGLKPSNWTFYEVYGLFRLAVIAQQIYYRYHHQQTRNPAFKNYWAIVNYLGYRCGRLIRKAGG